MQNKDKKKTDEVNFFVLFCLFPQELEMHARAHGIPTTPLTSDTTTALLSSILTAKPTAEALKIKQEPVESSVCRPTSCTQESQEAMDDYSIQSSSNPSPSSSTMDDDMTD